MLGVPCEGVLGVPCEGVLGASVSLKFEPVLGGSEDDVFSDGVLVYSDGRPTKSGSSTTTLGAAHAEGKGYQILTGSTSVHSLDIVM